MNKFAYLLPVGLLFLTILVSSCSTTQTDRAEREIINLGDQIDDMVFTSNQEMIWDISLMAFCDFDTAEDTGVFSTVNCIATEGDDVFFGNCNGVWFDNPNEADALWRELELEVTFDGYEINLPTFGYLDIDLPYSDKEYARIWNLTVENISLGTHTIECKEGSDGVNETRTFVFTVSE